MNLKFLGGQVLVHCSSPLGQPSRSSQLILDYVTDSVLSSSDISGDPYVSPDSRYVVVVDDEGDTITVYKINEDGKRLDLFN